MSEISGVLEQLVKLQTFDTRINSIVKRIEAIPSEKKEIIASLEQKKAAFDEERKKSQRIQLEINSKNAELEAAEALIKKHTTELNTIKTNQAYRALLDEIEDVKKRCSLIEDEILHLMEKAEKDKTAQAEMDRELKNLELSAAESIKSLDEEVIKLTDEMNSLKKEKEAIASGIKPAFLAVYEQMLRSRNGTAVVPLEGGGCGGCHMKLSVQNVNELVRVYSDGSQSKELVRCENCSRILYFKEKPFYK